MKTLYMREMYFKLPDDFEGGDAEALRLFADYLDEVKHPSKVQEVASEQEFDELTVEQARQKSWILFLSAVQEGRRLLGSFGIHETEPPLKSICEQQMICQQCARVCLVEECVDSDDDGTLGCPECSTEMEMVT